jgi:anaerobic selenocysteine-containing dehydrogenase
MKLRTVRTMCPMNCHPTLCGMLVDVDEAGAVRGVRGDPDNPDSRGFLCVRGHAAREIAGNPRRLLHPMRRRARSGAWEKIGWDDALDLIADRARAVGPEAVGIWSGHGLFANDYGTRISSELLRRFANLYGCQWWNPTTICWGLGAFGLGLTGVLRVNTKEDMGESAALVVLWGANLASQPNTGRHLAAARRRGAWVVAIDVRRTEASAQADETILIRPGTDAALALGMMHVIVKERLYDAAFVSGHTVGFEALAARAMEHDVAWASAATGIPAGDIEALARRYAGTRPAMILLGGSSMNKGAAGWQAGRAVGCLPALTGNLGVKGGGLGPRHGAAAHGQDLASIAAEERRPPGARVPDQMSRITASLEDGSVRALLLFGTDMLSSFADAGRVDAALARLDLLGTYDLFMHDTARRHADLALPATSWLEDTGCKSTNTHLYLMPKILDPPGEARSPSWVLRELAARLGVRDFFPWADVKGAIDAILDHPSTGHATVAALEAEGGIRARNVSHVAYPDLAFDTPSGKVEFLSSRAAALGLPALPVFDPAPASDHPLSLRTGRTLTHFHAFYDHGRALPSLAAADPGPCLWISPADAASRGIADGDPIRVFNQRGEMSARALVTARIPPGTVWIHDGWGGLNTLTSGGAVLPDAAVDLFGFGSGQAEFEARVEVALQHPPGGGRPDAGGSTG